MHCTAKSVENCEKKNILKRISCGKIRENHAKSASLISARCATSPILSGAAPSAIARIAAPKAQAEKNRRQKKARYEANREAINAKRSIERKEARKRQHTCEVCGKEYFGLYTYGCCSPECADRKRDLMKKRRKAFRHRELPPNVPRLRRKID